MALVRVTCPTCGAAVAVDDQVPLPPQFPFCTERCRLVDLGRWFAEDFRVSDPIVGGDEDADDDEDERR